MSENPANDHSSPPEDEVSLFKHIISQLGIGKSLANVTLPAWILEHRSILERFTDWMLNADILRRLNDEELPEIRMIHICSWIISGFRLTPKLPKKPYSSMNGECFRASLFNNTTENPELIGTYVAEQVSQHPSVCAFHYVDRVGNIIVWGNAEMRSKILFNSVAAIMDGPNTRVNIEHLKRNESYVFNFPNMYGRGVFTGAKVLEIVGEVKIDCKQSGYQAKIEFLKKGLGSAKEFNSLKGKVSKVFTNAKGKQLKETVIEFKGRFDDRVYYWYTDNGKTSQMKSRMNLLDSNSKLIDQTDDSESIEQVPQKSKNRPLKRSGICQSAPIFALNSNEPEQILMYDKNATQVLDIVVPPIEEQGPFESQFVWRKVTEYLENGDVPSASKHQKSIVEKQKKIYKYFQESQEPWEYQLFDFNEEEKRFIPKNLDMTLHADDEPPQQIHPPFPVPPHIARLEESGYLQTNQEIQDEVEAALHTPNSD